MDLGGDGDAVAALVGGFKSFPVPAPPRERSRSVRLRSKAAKPFYVDLLGSPQVLDSHGCIKPELFPEERAPAGALAVIGPVPPARRRRRLRADVQRPASPPGRRYFKRAGAAAKGKEGISVVDLSWEIASAAAEAALGTSAPEPPHPQSLGDPQAALFVPCTAPGASEADVSCTGAARLEARRAKAHARCRREPTDGDAWLEFAELQWSVLADALGAPARQVREQQGAILDAALRAQPADTRLWCAALRAEGEVAADGDREQLLQARRERLLACEQRDALEDCTWAFVEAAAWRGAEGDGQPPLVEAVRRAAAEALSILAAKKPAAGHDGRVWTAVEMAELAAVSALALAEASCGHGRRALETLRGPATLTVFFPGAEPEALRDFWTRGCRLGACGALYELLSLRLMQAAWLGAGQAAAELPPALSALGDLVEAAASSGGGGPAADTPADAGDLSSLLGGEGGPLRRWAGQELRAVPQEAADLSFDELRPCLPMLRTEPARREALLRFLDLLGAPTLARHAPLSRYRAAVDDALAPLGASCGPGAPSGGRGGQPTRLGGRLLPDVEGRALLARAAVQGLVNWPRDVLLQEALMHALWSLGSPEQKLPRRVLRASEDPRLYFAYARGLWSRGDREAAREVLLKLSGTPLEASPCDARIAVGWWHLESQAAGAAQEPEAAASPGGFQILRALAIGKFDAAQLRSAGPAALAASDSGAQCLQAMAKLHQVLPSLSRADAGGFRGLLSSYHATLVAWCALAARSCPRRALDLFLAAVPPSTPPERGGVGGANSTATVLRQGQAAAEQSRCWELATSMLVEVLAGHPGATPGLLLEAIREGLRWNRRSPWLLRALAAVHLRRGTHAAMRRELDHYLGLHGRQPLVSRGPCGAQALRVALEAELACGPSCSYERLVGLCQRAAELQDRQWSFAGASAWALCHVALLHRARARAQDDLKSPVSDATDREARWRAAVLAVARQPLSKALRVLQLAAWEARGDPAGAGAADEEELVDLVAQMEANRMPLHSDPLEAIA